MGDGPDAFRGTIQGRHLMVSWVTGSFKEFHAHVETENHDITTGKVHFTANLSSISTNNEQRDIHLRSGDFFDADHHPQITFDSTRIEMIRDAQFKLHGILTIRGISKPVVLQGEFGGIVTDPWGKTRAGFSIAGKINRGDFGVSFSMLSETGGVLLGDEVSINANAESVANVLSLETAESSL